MTNASDGHICDEPGVPAGFGRVHEKLASQSHIASRGATDKIAQALALMPQTVQRLFLFESPDWVQFVVATDIAICAPRPALQSGHTVVLDRKWLDLCCSARVGVLGHEFAHIEYYRSHGEVSEQSPSGELMIDAIVVRWGLGEYLSALFRHQLEKGKLTNAQRDFTNERLERVRSLCTTEAESH